MVVGKLVSESNPSRSQNAAKMIARSLRTKGGAGMEEKRKREKIGRVRNSDRLEILGTRQCKSWRKVDEPAKARKNT